MQCHSNIVRKMRREVLGLQVASDVMNVLGMSFLLHGMLCLCQLYSKKKSGMLRSLLKYSFILALVIPTVLFFVGTMLKCQVEILQNSGSLSTGQCRLSFWQIGSCIHIRLGRFSSRCCVHQLGTFLFGILLSLHLFVLNVVLISMYWSRHV